MALPHVSLPPAQAYGGEDILYIYIYIYISNISWKPGVLDPITNPYLGTPSWLHPVTYPLLGIGFRTFYVADTESVLSQMLTS